MATTSMPPSPSSQRSQRRSSQACARQTPTSPMHSRHNSLTHRRKASGSSTISNDGILSPNGHFGSSLIGGNGEGSGMGNLEDELAGAWEENEEEDEMVDEDTSQTQVIPNGIDVAQNHSRSKSHAGEVAQQHTRPPNLTIPNGKSTSPKQQRKRNDTTTSESLYDGSDYGEPDTPPASIDLPPELRMLIRDVEELAYQGSHMFLPPSSSSSRPATNGTSPTKQRTPSLTSTSSKPYPDTFGSFHARLRDLGGQTTLEALTSRLITAHASITTHLTHQTRTLQSAAFPLLSPLSIAAGTGPAPNDIDDLLVLVAETLESLPQPSFTSLNSLSHLHATGKEAVSALAGLSDSLHMSRQVESSAARRLKSARECAGEMRKEYELEEMGRRWIENGGWERKLKNREAKTVCREVTGGFEEVCEGWRRRLVDAAAAQGVAEVSA